MDLQTYENLKPGDLLVLNYSYGRPGIYAVVKKTDSEWTYCGRNVELEDKTSAVFIDKGTIVQNIIVLCNSHLVTVHKNFVLPILLDGKLLK